MIKLKLMLSIQINKNHLKRFKGDLFGGITAGVIALPLALAFGVASGIGAAAGLYGAIFVGLFASIFGGTKPQISGPTGPMTVVLASIIVTNPGNYDLIFLSIILAGVFQIIFGILKVGKLVKYVPYPVISGFMSGVGVIIILLQLNPLLGLQIHGDTISSVLEIIKNIQNFNFQSLILGIITLLIVFFTPYKLTKLIPSSLLALIFVTILSLFLDMNVRTIGEIPTTLPNFHFPIVSIEQFTKIIPFALTLAILGSVDSLLTSLVSDSLTKTTHKPNKELIGQGIGNVFSGFFGGIAGAGATMRTVVNVKSGGRTPVSGVVHSLFLIFILLFASPFAKYIPMTVLAGILIKVGFDVIDYKFLKLLKYAPKYDLIVMILVFALTVFDDLIFAVGMGIVLSSILFAASIASQVNISIDDIKASDNLEEDIDEKSQYKIRMINIDGVFFFGSASRILTRTNELLGTKCVIINCKNIPKMDISAIFALEDMIYRLKDKSIIVILIVNNKEVKIQLFKLGLLNIIEKQNIFYTEDKAIKKAFDFLSN